MQQRIWCTVFFLLYVTSSWAWKWTEDFQKGFYWNSLPLNFVIVESDTTRRNQLLSAMQEAERTWENEVGRDVWNFSAVAAGGSGNIIRWSQNFTAETGLSASSILAVTIRYASGPYMVRSEIIINGNHLINSYPTYLQTVLIHELAHTIGLDHSEYSDAVMAASLSLGYQGLHFDDREGINAVVDETLRRQAIGYVSPLSSSSNDKSSNTFMACGTVQNVKKQSHPSPLVSFLGQIFLGGLITQLLRLLRLFTEKRRVWRKKVALYNSSFG